MNWDLNAASFTILSKYCLTTLQIYPNFTLSAAYDAFVTPPAVVARSGGRVLQRLNGTAACICLSGGRSWVVDWRRWLGRRCSVSEHRASVRHCFPERREEALSRGCGRKGPVPSPARFTRTTRQSISTLTKNSCSLTWRNRKPPGTRRNRSDLYRCRHQNQKQCNRDRHRFPDPLHKLEIRQNHR